MKNTEVQFVVKNKFAMVLENNIYLKKLHCFEKEIDEIVEDLKKEKFDLIIDLHNNLRSKILTRKLGVKTFRFKKLNIRKWILVNLKKNLLPKIHIVDRYISTIPFPEIKYDDKGLDYFSGIDKESALALLPENFKAGYNVFVIGGAHFTKQIPTEILIDLALKSPLPVVLAGGENDSEKANLIMAVLGTKTFNGCGKLTLNQSAALIEHCKKVVTGDTGLMHIAAAYNKEIHSFWGNTVPEFGMNPFLKKSVNNNSFIYQVENLNCRPCSKIGFNQCPKKHFNCMKMIDYSGVFTEIN